jgi:hypothetical protein
MNLLQNCLSVQNALGEYGIDDKRRMKEVIREIANTIRTWAPDPGQARICHLAINEVADRLIREAQELTDG